MWYTVQTRQSPLSLLIFMVLELLAIKIEQRSASQQYDSMTDFWISKENTQNLVGEEKQHLHLIMRLNIIAKKGGGFT